MALGYPKEPPVVGGVGEGGVEKHAQHNSLHLSVVEKDKRRKKERAALSPLSLRGL